MLGKLAEEAGISLDAITAAPSYADVARMLSETTEGQGTEEEEAAPEEEPWKPTKGEQLYYKPIDPKTKKVGKKVVKVEVTLVDVGNETVTLKRLDTKATIEGVKWDKLLLNEE